MAKYTYADVIIDPEDPRVEIGAEYYFALGAQACIEYANSGRRQNTLDGVDKSGEYNPFITDEKDYPFIIRKAEQEKKYIPFDLSDLEVRDKLRGKWIKSNHSPYPEDMITAFNLAEDGWRVNYCYSAEELLKDWMFLDGTPCGKLVEVENNEGE